MDFILLKKFVDLTNESSDRLTLLIAPENGVSQEYILTTRMPDST